MSNYSYNSTKFDELLTQLQKEQANGILYISSQLDSDNHGKHALGERILSSVLVWKNGAIVYGNWKITSGREIAKHLLFKLNPKMAKVALKLVISKINYSSSPRQFLSLLNKAKALKWKQIEAAIQTQVASVIEQVSAYPGTARLDNSQHFDLSFGEDEHSLNWSRLERELKERQQKWEAFSPEIPSFNAVPKVIPHKFATIAKIPIRQHIQKYMDGKRSLIEIAVSLDKDPLNLARSYHSWVKSGWISFENHSPSNLKKDKLETSSSESNHAAVSQDLPTILSVDDSLIVQTSIKRALKDDYNVFLSDNAVEALKILNNNKIDLLLLDVTMPGIDGLEMCKTLRNIPKFKHLPIVMVTARDTLVDKMKGQIAGTNHYLTKPFDNKKLRKVINKFIKTGDNSPMSA